MELRNNEQLQLAFNFIQKTGRNVFLTGKAGTGKTTFLHILKKQSPKRMVVVAPTGVAAINAGGVTIHSFFQMPFGPYIPNYVDEFDIYNDQNTRNVPAHAKKFNREKINIIKSLDLLVIDEVSMVRADLLDGIDEVLRRYKNRSKPFGGVQLLMIGDLQQLAPIIKDDEWELLKPYYDNLFFFGSKALQKTDYISIELVEIFRQSDTSFISLLNRIRENKADKETLESLNVRYCKSFNPNEEEGYITLTTHNRQAQNINDSKLKGLPAKKQMFKAIVKGEFPEHIYPTEEELELKVGAQVMFVKNDPSPEKQFYNGKIGTIVGFEDDIIQVKCPERDNDIEVEALTWQNMKYSINEETKEIGEKEIGSFTQYPLKLAWAITIHKSQGLTFEKAIIDAQAAFAHGQVYVALSRCRSLEGLVLSTPISSKAIISNSTVYNFTKDIENKPPDQRVLNDSILDYQIALLDELFDFSFLKWNINYIIKVIKENEESIIGNPSKVFEKMSVEVQKDILEVADKFSNQRKLLFKDQNNIVESNTVQERVIKASNYFLEKIFDIVIDEVGIFSFETDNKVIKKSINDAIKRFHETLLVKRACLENSQNGFKIQDYLEVRAKSVIMGRTKKEKKIEVSTTDEILHPVLFHRMKKWRMERASEKGLPAYMVLHQKALLGVVNSLPQNSTQLKRIKGVGDKTVSQFGDEILALVADYCLEKKIIVSQEAEPKPEKPPPKKHTRQISRELLEAGNSIDEIAAERGFSVRTIEQHLAYFVGRGELQLNQFVTPDKASLIIDFYKKNPTNLMNPAKEALGDKVSYSDIQFVLKYLEYEKNI